MFRPTTVVWVTLALTLGGCIQRKLYCPPMIGAGSASMAGTGANLVGPTGLKAFGVNGEADKVAVSVVPVTGQSFNQAIRAEVKKGSGHEWSVQLQAPTLQAVDEGDVLLATFFLRADTPLEDQSTVQTQFVFEEAKSPYDKSVTYDVQAGPDWREIHVPFVAKRGFAPGDAHMIFRLGYDPETFEIGGVTIEDFGKKVKLAQLPTTRPWSPPKRAVVVLPPIDAGPLAIEVDTTRVVGPISPYVYGINSQPAAGLNVTVRRMGGNRQTGYNWEINASNAGSDYQQQSDDWPCTVLGYKNCNEPAAQFLDFAGDNKKLGTDTLATVPLVDYVAADKSNTPVSEAEKAPSKRWDKSLPHKPGAYAATPDLNDGAVYEDEFVDFLVKKLGKADAGGIRFYSLDNEPALWPSTHPRIHPEKTTYREMVSRTEATASVLTTLDPSAFVLGGVMFGWSEYQSLNDAPDSKEFNAQYETYADYWLASMKQLEGKYHRRLVHALDIHWYPEARGTKRITDADDSPKTVEARVQAPRALWDPKYREKSWIDDAWGKPIRLIPWLEEKIAKRYPGTRLTMTEYDFGGGNHVSGGLAQADVLGVFGREGMYLADYWGSGPGNDPLPNYVAAAFKLYRNYDGKGGAYGDTAVTATAPDTIKTSVFASTDSKHPGRLTVIVINKDPRAKFAGTVAIKGATKYAVAHVYRFDSSSSEVRSIDSNVAIRDNKLGYDLPPMTATLFVCDAH
jgi:hypothetical protein